MCYGFSKNVRCAALAEVGTVINLSLTPPISSVYSCGFSRLHNVQLCKRSIDSNAMVDASISGVNNDGNGYSAADVWLGSWLPSYRPSCGIQPQSVLERIS